MSVYDCLRVRSIRDEADAIAPGRRKDSDGSFVVKPGGHNRGARGLVHAQDLGHCMPGTAYWLDHYDEFDVFRECYEIAGSYINGSEAYRFTVWRWLFDGGYIVWHDLVAGHDLIFNPRFDKENGRGPTVRVVNKTEHFQHAHFEAASTVAAENDTTPIFGGSDVLSKTDKDEIVHRVLQGVGPKVEAAIADKFAGYDKRGRVPNLLLIKLRELVKAAPPKGG